MDNADGKLVIVPTPIGNLGDITLRALDVLRACDVVFAEDTRVTGKLLSAYDIKKRMMRMDENTISKNADALFDEVVAGKTVAYCTDAGMPGVSDPGLRLVAMAHERCLAVEVLPGSSAAATAYVASGFTDTAYYFGGFFPRKKNAQAQLLEKLGSLDASLVFYESPKRLCASLASIAEAFPKRRVAVCRELTKMHEEILVSHAKEVLDAFATRERTSPIKGEIVIVIEGHTDAPSDSSDLQEAVDRDIAEMFAQGHALKDISQMLADRYGISKNGVYERAVHMKKDGILGA